MKLHNFVAYLAAAFFLLYGLAFSISPNGMSDLVTGASLQNVSALVDFRATYGGMTLAVGIVILYLHRVGQVRLSLVALMIVLLGMAAARAIGFFVDGATNTLMCVYFSLEIAGSLLAWVAWRRLQVTPSE